MAPVFEFSGDMIMDDDDCTCEDLVKKIDSVLRVSLKSAIRKAEEVLQNDLHDLLSTWMPPEMPTRNGWYVEPSSGGTIWQDQTESRTTTSTEDKIHFALIRAIVLVTVIGIVLVSTCRLVLQFATRTYRITE